MAYYLFFFRRILGQGAPASNSKTVSDENCYLYIVRRTRQFDKLCIPRRK